MTTTTTTTTTPTITIERQYDNNERIREGRNGRTYVSRGRWIWFVLVDGSVESDHTTKRDAMIRAVNLRAVATPRTIYRDRDLADFAGSKSQERAVATFVETVVEIGDLLKKLQDANGDHYGYDVDAINYGHVGTAQSIRRRLREIVDSL